MTEGSGEDVTGREGVRVLVDPADLAVALKFMSVDGESTAAVKARLTEALDG